MHFPDKIRKNHTDIPLTKPFPELYRGHHYNTGGLLVATLYRVWESGSTENATRYLGCGMNCVYMRLYELESRVGCPVFVRFARPFTLTSKGEELIRRYLE